MLVSGIMDNLTNTFSSVNDQVGQIAVDVGRTPSSFLPAVFNMVRNLSESVIMPVAGILLTFIACYELIQLIISYNNLASFETWFIWKWIFKTFVAVELITHTFDITMAVFDVSQSVVRQAGGLIQGSTAIDADALQTMQATLEAMELGSLLGIFLQSFIVQFLMYVLAAVIFVIINGRMVEIYLMVSLAPIPFATFGNREQSMMGQNYLRGLFALGFQGFLIMVCVGIYKLKLSGGDIKAVQGDSGHAQADMVTEVYGHILDEDRKKNAQMMERAFYNKENLNPDMHGQAGAVPNNSISVPGGIDAELLAKVLENPEMAALFTSLAKTMKIS